MPIKPDPVTGYLPPGFRRTPAEAPAQAEPRRERKFDANGCLIPPGTPPIRPTRAYVVPPTPAQIAADQQRRKEAREASEAAVARWPEQEVQELQRLVQLVLTARRKIWTDGTNIFVNPPLNGAERECAGLYARILQAKSRLIALLPHEPQPPQII